MTPPRPLTSPRSADSRRLSVDLLWLFGRCADRRDFATLGRAPADGAGTGGRAEMRVRRGRVRRRMAIPAVAALVAPLIIAAPAGAAVWPGDWPTWQGNTLGDRYNPAEHRITPANV